MDLQLPPDIESVLRIQAAQAGVDVERFAIDSLRRLVASEETSGVMLPRTQWKMRFDAMLARLPERPTATFVDDSRESIYGDDGR
jgi:hypothetical protein